MSGRVAFWSLAALLAVFLAASVAPSPLYAVYQSEWGFSEITLTSVFALYALTLLAALLCFGSVSDRVGRRPVIAVGLALEIVCMALFLLANGPAWLFAARAVQGLATGLMMAAVTAAVIDLEPADRSGFGAFVNACAPLAGLAVGALATGLLVQYAAAPTHLVFWLLGGLFVGGLIMLLIVPETVRAEGSWFESLRPRMGIPRNLRRQFAAVFPALAATWSLGGFFLSLGPSLATQVLGNSGELVGGLVIFVLAGTGFGAAVAVRNWEAEPMMIGGLSAFAVGVSAAIVALEIPSTALFFLGTFLAGFGFGPGFLGAFRTLAVLAPADRRAELIAVIYAISYLSFSLPAIAAGVAATEIGLKTTAAFYGGLTVVLAITATLATAYERRRLAAA